MKREHQTTEERYGRYVDAFIAGGKFTRSMLLGLLREVGDSDYSRGYIQCERKWAKRLKAEGRRRSQEAA